MIRRRRAAAPAAETSAEVLPISRAQRQSDAAAGAAATAPAKLELGKGTRSRFAELTPVTGTATVPEPSTRTQRSNASRAPARARRANAAPEPHDGWTFVLIPPGAGARPRTLRVSVRRLRFVVASFCVVFGSTLATGGLLVLALSFLPPAQDEVRGVELGLFAGGPTAATPLDAARVESVATTPAAIAAASAGAAAPRAVPARPRPTRNPAPARAAHGDDDAGSMMESLPVVGEITSRFARARRHPLLGVVRKHAGIDIAAPAGTQITAPASGRVRFSGRKFGYGYTVDIDHGNGVITRYAHCRALMVREGDEVAAGAVIATVGRSGLATAPHLHYEVLVHGRNVNPLTTSLAALIAGKRPPKSSEASPPSDSALRPPGLPLIPDAISAPDIPEIQAPVGDTLDLDTPDVPRTSSLASVWSPSVLPALPPPLPGDTARRS